jgi:hypothetical protein
VQPIAGEGDPRRRSKQIRLAVKGSGVERARALDLLLAKRLFPVVGGEIEAVARHDPALVHRILVGVAQADEQPPRGERRRVEPSHHPDRLEREFASVVELAAQPGQLARPGSPV